MNSGPADPRHHAQLIARIAAGADREAFVELFDYFAPRLKGFLMRGGVPAEHAEDLSQETLLMVWRKAAQFDASRASAGTWIFTIARNLRVDGARQGVFEAVRSDVVFDDAAIHGEAAGGARDDASEEVRDGVEAVVSLRQRARRVREAIQSLPDDQSTVVMMAFFQGKAHADVAQELALPLGTVKSRLRLATQKLRALLGALSE